MRVWIETEILYIQSLKKRVTLYVRVWIETETLFLTLTYDNVTLYVRVWIETMEDVFGYQRPWCHPLREGVD